MGSGYGGAYYPTGSQVGPTPKKTSAEEAGKNLARLMERQLGYDEGHIDSIALRLFIRAYWSRISPWAHVIHDEE